MRRRMFDILLSSTGGVLAIVLLVAGGLLFWGYSFANATIGFLRTCTMPLTWANSPDPSTARWSLPGL